MKNFPQKIISILVFQLAVVATKDKIEPTVLAVTQIIRKGVSTPKSENFDFTTLKKYKPDTLIRNGERMMFRLGQEMKQHYKQLLDKDGNLEKSRFYSDPSGSSVQSAQAFSIGFQMGLEGQKITKEKLTIPPFKGLNYTYNGASALPSNLRVYPIETEKRSLKKKGFFIDQQKFQCPKFFEKINERNQKIDQATQDNFLSLIENLRDIGATVQGKDKESGWNYQTLNILFRNSEVKLFSEDSFNDELDPETYEMLKAWYTYTVNIKFFHGIAKDGAYLTHSILSDILENFNNVSSPKKDLKIQEKNLSAKYRVFMTDGIQVYILLRLLDLSPKKCLEKMADKGLGDSGNCLLFSTFGSYLTFELSEHEKKHYVRILANLIPIPLSCESSMLKNGYCLLEDFTHMVKGSLLKKDFDNIECSDKEFKNPLRAVVILSKKARDSKMLCGAVWTFTLLALISYLCVICKQKAAHNLDELYEKYSSKTKIIQKSRRRYSGLATASIPSIKELTQLRGFNDDHHHQQMISPANEKKKFFGSKDSLEEIKEEKNEELEKKGPEFKMKIKSLEEDFNFSIDEEDNDQGNLDNVYEKEEMKKKSEDGGSSTEHLSPDNFKSKLRGKKTGIVRKGSKNQEEE